MRLFFLLLLTTSLFAGDYEKGWAAVRIGDYKQAIELWKPLAEKGNGDAQSNIALIYCSGDGEVLQDFSECTYWAKKARAQGKNISHLWNEFQLWKYDN